MKATIFYSIWCLCTSFSTTLAQVLPAPHEPKLLPPGPPGGHPIYDRKMIKERLAVAPRQVDISLKEVTPSQVAPNLPKAQNTKTVAMPESTKVAQPMPETARVYDDVRGVVSVIVNKQNRDMSFVTVPVVFVAETAELLNDESVTAIAETAMAIKEITVKEPAAKFEIEGHTCVKGLDEFNDALSSARAKRIYDELTARHGISHTTLSAHGYGENFAAHPNGTEAQMRLDDRVLVVRSE